MLPADGDFGAAFGPARLAMLADGAEITKGCQKPDIKLTIDPDASLADRLNPARDEWQQIYQLLKTQKIAIQEDSGVSVFFGVVCESVQPPLPAIEFHQGPALSCKSGVALNPALFFLLYLSK